MRRVATVAVAASSVLLPITAWILGTGVHASNEFRFEPIGTSGDVYVVRGGIGTNSVVLANDAGILVVDAKGDHQTGTALRESLLERWPDKTISDILLTHAHRDGAGGLDGLRGARVDRSARTLAHDATTDRLRKAGAPTPDAGFLTRFQLRFGDETVTCHHKGHAHTDGDLVVHFNNAQVLAVGGLVANRIHPAFRSEDGGDLRGWARTLTGLAQDFTDSNLRVVPADGATGGREILERQAIYLRELIDHVDAAHDHGWSEAESSKEAARLREQFRDYGGDRDHFEQVLREAFKTLR